MVQLASQSQAANTDITSPTTSDSKAHRVQHRINSAPPISWANSDGGVVNRHIHINEVLERNRNAIGDTARASERGVAAAPDRKLTLGQARNEHRDADIIRFARQEDTRWRGGGLDGRPVRRRGEVCVRSLARLKSGTGAEDVGQ